MANVGKERMRPWRGTALRLAPVAISAILFSERAWAEEAVAQQSWWAPLVTLPNIFAALLVVAFVVAAGLLRNALVASGWTIADALSEEADVTLFGKDGQPLIENGKAVIGSQLRASVSRFIAMFGLIAVLIVYFGFGVVIARRLAANEQLPTTEQFGELQTFLFSGATLFAPYIVNKFSSIFDWLKPKG